MVNDASRTQKQELNTAFVKSVFNGLANNPATTYSEYRWERNAAMRIHYRQSLRTLRKAISMFPEKSAKSLEVGGGEGMWTPLIATRSERVDFVDLSADMIVAARKRLAAFSNIRFIESDFLTANLPSETYEIAMLFRSLEYMQKQDAIKKTAAVLRKHGILLIVTKNPYYKEWSVYYAGKKIHSAQIGLYDLSTLLSSSGYVIQAVYPATLGVHLDSFVWRFAWDVTHMIRLALPFLFGRSFDRAYSESFLICARKH